MSVRVYELSRKFGLTNKQMILILKDLGTDVSSHISVVSDDMIGIIEEELKVKLEKNKILKKNSENNKNNLNEKNENLLEDNSITLKSITPTQIAQKTNKHVNEVILTLLKNGIVSTKNQLINEESVKKVAEIFGLKIVESKNKKIEEAIAKKDLKSLSEKTGVWENRPPVIVVIGHVDHGKTTLLDHIRKTKVAAKEKGGITQHLGAYEVKTNHGKIVFLDTPGHEAFSMLRVRGLKAADIAILIVAADDGVKPQTIESIKHAQSIGLPIVIAINKVDKASPDQVEKVKQQLAQHNLIVEEWGGTIVAVLISAKEGTGIDNLLEVIALQSELMELKANISISAQGYILESNIEKGRGSVATVICQHGTLHKGDYFFAGNASGKVTSIVNCFGKNLSEVGPSIPVRVAGFSELPNAGDIFQVVDQASYKKGNRSKKDVLLSNIMANKSSKNYIINIILKTDNMSSKEALISSIEELGSKLGQDINIIHSGVGDISESDVILARDTDSVIYGFNVKTQSNALNSVQNRSINIKHFGIIYKLLEDLETAVEKLKPIEMTSKKIGEAVVIKIFNIKSLGTVAGAHVKSGRFTRDGNVVIWRGDKKVGEGKIKGLQRDKKSVKEVHAGFEFAFLVDGFEDWKIDDKVECYQSVPV